MRQEWIDRRRDDPCRTQMHYARQGIATEEMGYVASPHSSAGRIPTPRG